MPFLLANWRLVLLAVLLAAIGVQTWRLDRSQAAHTKLEAEFNAFKGAVAALGEQAKREAAAKEASDRANKEKADAENAKTRRDLAGVYDAYRKLRDARGASGGGLSIPGPITSGPAGTCFDPAQLRGALRALDEGILGIAQTGDQAVIDLDTAKRWAQTR